MRAFSNDSTNSTDSSTAVGILASVVAYCFWGLMPLYWRQLAEAAPVEILAHRIIWSFAFIMAGLVVAGRLPSAARVLGRLLRSPRENGTFIIVLAAVFASVNWLVNILGVNTGRVVELGLGMFLTPLATVALGVIVFSERLSGLRLVAVLLAACGVVVLIAGLDRFPWIAIGVSASWAIYGALKKKVTIDAADSVAIEHGLLLVPALAYIFFAPGGYASHFAGGFSSGLSLLLIGTGIMTSIPMVLFSVSAQKLPMTLLGIIQYLNPVLTLSVGVVVFAEPVTDAEKAALAFIFAAVVLYVVSSRQKQNPAS